MYMPDAIKSILEIMDTPSEKISLRSSYNISGVSFTPKTLSDAIKKEMPEFTISYEPDYRDNIAKSWPSSLDDSLARKDWGWKPDYDLESMVNDMLVNLRMVV
jgi:nucleoside-diphosphate-sugar epimerase